MENSYIAIDIETTGLDPKQDKIIEIGAIKVIDGKETASFETFVNPRRDLPERITELTGIRGEMLVGAPDIEEIIPKVMEFVEALPLLGHRVIFDYSFLKRAAINWGKAASWEKQGIDTLTLCRCFMPAEEKKNLSAACGYFNISLENAHRAVVDARAAHLLFQHLAAAYKGKRPEIFREKPLIYQIKKEQPATKRQKERLHDLIKYHKIDISVQIDHLTRNEASRLTDQILSRYGKV